MRSHVACSLAVLVLVAVAGPAVAAEEATVHLTGKVMTVNGRKDVPAGLFGVHATPLTPERVESWGIECLRKLHHGPGGSMTVPKPGSTLAALPIIIDCQGDRYQPATCLKEKNFREMCAGWGEAFATRSKESGRIGYVEFWNEPYLNWAVKPGVNYDPKFYVTDEAEVGKPMRIKGWEEPLEHLVWSRQVRTVHADGGRTDINAYLAYAYIGRHKKAGETFEFRGRKFKNVEMWWGRDPTQKSYYSGKQNRQFYNWMLLPFARAVKKTYPNVQVIAGWDFNMFSGGWDGWTSLYKPTIDEAVEFIDGVSEHHYGSDPRRTHGAYELVTGYGQAAHGKWLMNYNTESSGSLDPEVPGTRHGKSTPYGAYNYGMRDILGALAFCPGKVASRTAHAATQPGWGGGGDEFTFKLLKPLRGPLVKATSRDREIWPVACAGERSLVLALYSDRAEDSDVTVRLDAPEGDLMTGAEVTRVEPTEPKGPLAMKTVKLDATGENATVTVRVPAKSGVRLVIRLNGPVDVTPKVERRQFFAPDFLGKVAAGEPLKTTVEIDKKLLDRAEEATLQLVLEGMGEGEGTVTVGRESVALPARDQIVRVPVGVKALAATTPLAFECAGDGYRVVAASVILDAPAR